MKRLLIVGAGGWGREVLAWALDVQPTQKVWEVGGFLDANPQALQRFDCHWPILGDPQGFQPSEEDLLICAIGDPRRRLALCQTLKQRGASFITLIHPTALVGPRCHLGEGCVLCPYVVITTDVTIGDFVGLNIGTVVGHDATIGRGAHLNPHSEVLGGASLGEGAFLGTNVIILPGAVVGNYATVGAGSVVLRRVEEKTTVMGVPARRLEGF